MEKLIWQVSSLYPSGEEAIKNYKFKINLDYDFARKMINSKVSNSKKDGLNELTRKRFNITSSNPFQFYEDSGLVNMIELGMNGRWLNISVNELKYNLKSKKNLEYYTHNIENITDVYNLIGLFDLWVSFSEALIE